MSSKIDKAMLKNPDVFVSTSDKVFNFIEHHFKTAASVAGIVVVCSLGYVGYNYVRSTQEQRAAEALYQPEAALKKAEAEALARSTPPVQTLEKGKKEAAKPEPVAAPDYGKDFAPLVDNLKSKLREYSDTKAALVSALNLSYFLNQQKQFALALEVLEIPKFKPNSNELLNGFWLMHKGYTLLENNQVDRALEAYQTVTNSADLKPFQPEALLKLGICFELKNEMDKARASYERVGREFPQSESSQTAEQYLRLLDLKTAQQG